jgi:hypothetical protein
MRIIDATPPKNFPGQVIVLDNDLAERQPNKAFYLRVQVSETKVTIVPLDGEVTLPGARNAAVRSGYHPTHWLETRIGYPARLD